MSSFSQKLERVDSQMSAIKTDENQVPVWLSSLLACFESLVEELKEFNQFTAKVAKMDDCIKVSKIVTDTLESDRDRLSKEVKSLRSKVDEQEQRSRNINLLIHGVPEEVGENTTESCIKIFSDELNIDVSPSVIVRSHILGPIKQGVNTRNSKPRPLIIKFSNFAKRQEVFKSKKYLKGRPYVITENLTKSRYELLQAAVKKLGKGNVWTNEGHILTKFGNKIKSIKEISDLEEIE